MKIDITLTHPGQIIGEQIRGFVSIHVNSPTLIKGVTVYVRGESHTYYTHPVTTTKIVDGKTVTETNDVTEYVNTKVYESPDFPVIEELHNHNTNLTTELAPGHYDYPFIIQLPQGIPSSLCFQDRNINLKYKIYAKVTSRKGGHTTSSGFDLPICITPQRHIPRQRIFVDNTTPFAIQLAISDEIPAVGDTIQMQMQCVNTTNSVVKLSASFVAIHTYNNTTCESSSGYTTFPDFSPQSTNTTPAFATIPIDLPVFVTNDPFNVSTYIRIEGYYNRRNFQVMFPIVIGSDISNPQLMCDRAALFGGRRDFTKMTAFYGSHFRMSPNYQAVTNPKLPPGIEEIETPAFQKYYISHFTRQSSMSPDMSTVGQFPYPSYNCALLPPGWSMGMDYGEPYFIDHNTKTTSWIDPRPMERRVIPHVVAGRSAIFTVE
ncbi:arrestin (or S antigen) N-terminal domain containing protein, partial [Entamoeba invadens IP1]